MKISNETKNILICEIKINNLTKISAKVMTIVKVIHNEHLKNMEKLLQKSYINFMVFQ